MLHVTVVEHFSLIIMHVRIEKQFYCNVKEVWKSHGVAEEETAQSFNFG